MEIFNAYLLLKLFLRWKMIDIRIQTSQSVHVFTWGHEK